jgi:hypothetical protein
MIIATLNSYGITVTTYHLNYLAMDEKHLLAVYRYVAMNPVKAKMDAQASDWA